MVRVRLVIGAAVGTETEEPCLISSRRRDEGIEMGVRLITAHESKTSAVCMGTNLRIKKN